MIDRRAIGIAGERKGIDFLKKNGYKIVARNFRSPYGEIDVIAEKDSCMVFVEVKCRRTGTYGYPFEAVDRRKQEHMTKTALHFVKSRNVNGFPLRFDVLSIGPGPDQFEIIPDAFLASSRYTY